MKEVLESHGVSTEFAEVADDEVYIGYNTNQQDASKLFVELQAIVATALDEEPGKPITGAFFHTNYPSIGLWEVEADLAQQYRDGSLSETGLMVKVLQTLQIESMM